MGSSKGSLSILRPRTLSFQRVLTQSGHDPEEYHDIVLSSPETAHGEFVPSVKQEMIILELKHNWAPKAEVDSLCCGPTTIHRDPEYE